MKKILTIIEITIIISMLFIMGKEIKNFLKTSEELDQVGQQTQGFNFEEEKKWIEDNYIIDEEGFIHTDWKQEIFKSPFLSIYFIIILGIVGKIIAIIIKKL